jgi:hypothetical protein
VFWKFSPLREKSFSLIPVADAATPTVKVAGNGDSEIVSPLGRILRLVHATLIENACTAVSVDLSELYFLNSSCLKAFVTWIHQAKTAERTYEIRLRMNPGLPWQRRSLEPLRRLAPGVVFLEQWGGPVTEDAGPGEH